MPSKAAGACANTFAAQGYIRIDCPWDWSVLIRKAVISLALLAGLILGKEDLEMILKQLLD